MFKIRTSRNGKFYFVLVAKNGQVLCTSEMYESKQSVRKGIRSMIRNINITTEIRDDSKVV